MTQKPHKIHQISLVLCSAAAGICQLICIHALGNILGILEMLTNAFDHINQLIFVTVILVLMGLSYYFIKNVVDHKFPYFLGALLLESVLIIMAVITKNDTISLENPMYTVTVELTYAFLPVLAVDAVFLIVSAIKKAINEKNGLAKDTKKAKTGYVCLLVAFFAAALLIISCKLLSELALMMLLPLPGIAYYYFQTYCKKPWLYTVVFAATFAVCVAVLWIAFSNPFLNDNGIMSITAAATVLSIDVVVLLVKKCFVK